MITKPHVDIVSINSIYVEDRFRKDYGDLTQMKESISKVGIINPLAVAEIEKGKYKLLAGGRRFQAMKEMETISTIPVRIYSKDINDYEMRSIELIENVERKDMTWEEEVRLTKEVHELQIKIYGEKVSKSPDAKGHSQSDTAKLLGKTRPAITQEIALAKALEVFPVLAKAKNKNEAGKLLKKIERSAVEAEMRRRIQSNAAKTPEDIKKKELCDAYIVKDAYDLLREVPDKSVNIIEIDPPYAIDLQNIKKGKNKGTNVALQNYSEADDQTYLSSIYKILVECRRIITQDGWLIFWYAPEPWFEGIYTLIKTAGFSLSRLSALWEKNTGQCQQPDVYLANCYEPFFYARVGHPSINKQGRSNIYQYRALQEDQKIHPTERPIELMEDVLGTFGWLGCRVMVPFLGSGNTILAANNLGMTAFGADIVSEYKDAYMSRVLTGTPGAYKSYNNKKEEE